MISSLLHNNQSGLNNISNQLWKTILQYSKVYKEFLNECKTERETINYVESMAKFYKFEKYSKNKKYNPGDKIYFINKEKSIILAIIGYDNSKSNIVVSHADSPKIDIKTVPLYEDHEISFLKTHYYGGIKKYHWLTIPLEIRGVVSKYNESKSKIENIFINIGSNINDPVFTITDLLPHLSNNQMIKTLNKAFDAESLNILLGTKPSKNKDQKNNKIKLAMLEYLYKKYKINEKDLISAEISMVPAYKARDVGLDRSLIGAYGHDDKSCLFNSIYSLFDIKDVPKNTCLCYIVDKEEIGSEGTCSIKSNFFDMFLNSILDNNSFGKSYCISADVTNALDPNYLDVSDQYNEAKINYGVALTKYTGHRGKYDSSEASSEFVGKLCYLFDKYDIKWQTSQLGKVDIGGGGTIAKYMANRNIETIDIGIPVLSMHAPFEIISKYDLYMNYLSLKVFFEKMI